jgi:catechol 2,3-dioxygenase-like lactoylglutathione lyase family enzyme
MIKNLKSAKALQKLVFGALLGASMSTCVLAGVPGMRGHDHTGITVPDMDQAVTFFTDVIGCEKIMSFGPFMDDKGSFMKDALNVHPRAVVRQIVQIRCGFGSNIELFHYESPDQQVVQPKNSDIGGYHIAIYVDDIKSADAYLKSKGVHTLFGPIPVSEGPAAGQTILYFLTPWGLQMEAISYPQGMAYEKDTDKRLWSARDPAK